jgi:hypothetical protein
VGHLVRRRRTQHDLWDGRDSGLPEQGKDFLSGAVSAALGAFAVRVTALAGHPSARNGSRARSSPSSHRQPVLT